MTGQPRRLIDVPHPDDVADPARPPHRAPRRVAVNVAESPLAWLASRRMIDARQHAAGERLRRDFEAAELSSRTTMRWDAPPPGRSPRGAPDAAAGTLAAIDARRRFHAAIDAAGPGLADVCWRVICAGEGLPDAERGLGWPARSGKLVLTLALDRLAAHYRLG